MGELGRNLVLFGRLLRRLGLDTTPEQTADLIRAVGLVGLSSRDDIKSSARALMVSRREQLEVFDRAFDEFWRGSYGAGSLPDEAVSGRPIRRESARTLVIERPASEEAPAIESEQPLLDVKRTWSPRELLRHKDFAELDPEETTAVRKMIQELDWCLDERRTRRRRPGRAGDRIDLRRVLRRSLRYGGEPIELSWRQRRRKPRRLVTICDVSGSMESYSRMLLLFLYGLSHGLASVEAFVFGTRLTRVTRQLRGRHPETALRNATAAVRDWAGGTRVGEALHTFNFRWARRVLGQGAVVLLISDGWDCGDVALLEREMERLSHSCHRLIWLNPLLGMAGYEPLTRGLQAALPHTDDFLPVHNLESLEQLGELLRRLGTKPASPAERALP